MLIGVRVGFSAHGGPAEDKQFFFEKKNRPQKTFSYNRCALPQRAPQQAKVFASFFKKKRFLASYVSTSRRARIAALIRCGSTIEKNISLDPNQLDQVPLPFQEVHMFFFVM